jgi:hypothetical protein
MAQDEDKTVILGKDQSATVPPAGAVGEGGAPAGRLICLDTSLLDDKPGQLEIPLRDDAEVYLGRDKACSVQLKSRKLSRKHARVFAGTGIWGVEDLDSTNGVFINNRRTGFGWINPGDEVAIGPIKFRYEVDHPEAVAAAAPAPEAPAPSAAAAAPPPPRPTPPQQAELPPAPPPPGDDDRADRTMMFGSARASEAVLEAVTAPEEEVPEEKRPRRPIRADVGVGPVDAVPVKRGRRYGLLVAALVAILIVAGGVVYFPQYLADKAIADVVRATSKSIAGIVESARNRTTSQIYREDYTDELTRVTGLSEPVRQQLAENPGNAALSALLSRLRFLEFERKFAGLFDQGDLDIAAGLARALIEDLDGIAAQVPEDASDGDVATVRGTIELAGYAEILMRFRAFRLAYPDVARNAPQEPPMSRLDELQSLKTQSIEIRRKNNRLLSVDYIVFKKIVEDVDSHDIALANAWREFMQNK